MNFVILLACVSSRWVVLNCFRTHVLCHKLYFLLLWRECVYAAAWNQNLSVSTKHNGCTKYCTVEFIKNTLFDINNKDTHVFFIPHFKNLKSKNLLIMQCKTMHAFISTDSQMRLSWLVPQKPTYAQVLL